MSSNLDLTALRKLYNPKESTVATVPAHDFRQLLDVAALTEKMDDVLGYIEKHCADKLCGTCQGHITDIRAAYRKAREGK